MLRKIIFLTVACLSSIAPAFPSDFLVFRQGQSRPYMIWKASSAPTPGVNIAGTDQSFPFVVDASGDVDIHNYLLSNGVVTYSPPPPPEQHVDPNAPDGSAFILAIFQDQTITPVQKSNIILLFPLLSQHINEPDLLQAAWGNLKASGSDWLSPELIAKVENYAETFHVKIVP